MRNRLTVAVAVVTVAAVAAAPAYAKSKPKPITKTYSVTLYPDPTPDVGSLSGHGPTGCDQSNPEATNDRVITVPAKGILHVVLDSPNPLPAAYSVGPDWDLYILDTDKSDLDSSHGGTAHEETFTKFKKGQKVTIEVCNLTGGPSGTVTYTFTYA